MRIINTKFIVSLQVNNGHYLQPEHLEFWVNNNGIGLSEMRSATKDYAIEKELPAFFCEDERLCYIRPTIYISTTDGKSEKLFFGANIDNIEIQNIARRILDCKYIELQGRTIVHLQMLVKQS